MTGDSADFNDLADLSEFNIIVATAEKFYALLKLWRENEQIAFAIKLLLIDEVHILNEENRGATLEALISRVKSISWRQRDSLQRNARFVAVSGTIPNAAELGKWLRSETTSDYKIFE